MFCPNCGSNQDVTKRFCTICGTNLQAVNQALTGQLPPVPVPSPFEHERQRETTKALRLTLIGGGLVAYKFFNFAFSGGSPFGVMMVFGFILLVMGITKMASLRTPYPVAPQPNPIAVPPPLPVAPPQPSLPQPVFSSVVTSETPSRNTNELPPLPLPQPGTSITEEETRHLNR